MLANQFNIARLYRQSIPATLATIDYMNDLGLEKTGYVIEKQAQGSNQSSWLC